MTTNPDEQAFLNAIISRVGDDVPRLVYADWLEDYGQADYAKFIRLQCELTTITRAGELYKVEKLMYEHLRGAVTQRRFPWLNELFDMGLAVTGNGFRNQNHTIEPGKNGIAIFRRGFVAEVRCTLTQWMGGECERCHTPYGSGMVITGQNGGTYGPCPNCNGTGRTVGIGPRLVKGNPIERVIVTDKTPFYFDRTNSYFWYQNPLRHDETNVLQENVLPDAIYDLLALGHKRQNNASYINLETAVEDLSRALIRWAREQP